MNDWQVIPEIAGCSASLRMAVVQMIDATKRGHHVIVEGEAGSGRRLITRSAWRRRNPAAHSLFTLDCRMFRGDSAAELLFGERSTGDSQAAIRLGKLNLAPGGGLLMLHVEELSLQLQGRLAFSINQYPRRAGQAGIQFLMTYTPSLDETPSLHSDLSAAMMHVRIPALRERAEDIRPIAEAFLRESSPFERIRISQTLIEKFHGYNWPGNVAELRSVLRRLLLEPHRGLLDVHHLSDAMYRNETSFTLLQGLHSFSPAPALTTFNPDSLLESRGL